MITDIWFENSNGEQKQLQLCDPYTTGYAVTEITGLSPTDVDIKTSQLASGNRFIYNKGFKKIREIEIKIQYVNNNNEHKTIQRLREELINLLKTDDSVKFAIVSDNGSIYYTEGWVSKNESPMFSQMCGATIKITCPDIFFYEGQQTGNNGYRKVLHETSQNSIVYNGTIYSDLCLIIPGGNGTLTAGLYTLKVTNNGKERSIKINIPANTTRFTASFFSDIPTFKRYTSNTEEDGAKYVNYRELIMQDDLPRIKPGSNIITFSGQGSPAPVQQIQYYVRHLGV